MITELKSETEALAKALGVVGLMNVQYAIKDDTIYVLEVNPRASRTVPFVAKATGVPIAKIGARVMAGAKLATDFKLDDDSIAPHVAVKEAVFPFARFPNVDTILGPEMKSTGEVMGLDSSFERAFAKAQLGAGVILPLAGTVLLSIKDADKKGLPALARRLTRHGLLHPGDARHRGPHPRGGLARHRGQQGAGRAAALRRCDPLRRGAACHQHRLDPAIGGGQLCDPPQRADPSACRTIQPLRVLARPSMPLRHSKRERLKLRRFSPTFAVRFDRQPPLRDRPGRGSRHDRPALPWIEGRAVQKFPMTAQGLVAAGRGTPDPSVAGASGHHPRHRGSALAWRPVGKRRVPRRARTPVVHRGPHPGAGGNRRRRRGDRSVLPVRVKRQVRRPRQAGG